MEQINQILGNNLLFIIAVLLVLIVFFAGDAGKYE